MAETIERFLNPKTSRSVTRARGSDSGIIPIALIAIAMTLIGFWRSFFTQLDNTDALHMVHGVSATGWLVLVLVQALLIRYRQFKWHRVLGWSSLLLFTVLIVSAWPMMALILSGKGSPMPFELVKNPIYSDVTLMPLMIFAYVGALVLRTDRHVHARLMSITLLAGLLPAISRVFLPLIVMLGIGGTGVLREEGIGEAEAIVVAAKGLAIAMNPTYIFVLVILAIAIFFDWKNMRLRWPYPLAFVWFAISYATLIPGSNSQWFDQLARWMASTA